MVVMFKIFKKIWVPKDRRKHDRVATQSTVKFKILDSKNPGVCSRLLQGEILDLSEKGLCIGTNTVQIDGLHVFHHPTMEKNKLEIEMELHPGQAALKTVGEVRWYRRVESAGASTYRVGVNWESLDKTGLEAIKKFLKATGKKRL
jgi:hypothetical protein